MCLYIFLSYIIFCCSDDFTAFADVCFREFGNTVKFWSTINEPNMLAFGGSGLGIKLPTPQTNSYRGNSSTNQYIALHNMLLTHASTASLYKKKYKVNSHAIHLLNVRFISFFISLSLSRMMGVG